MGDKYKGIGAKPQSLLKGTSYNLSSPTNYNELYNKMPLSL